MDYMFTMCEDFGGGEYSAPVKSGKVAAACAADAVQAVARRERRAHRAAGWSVKGRSWPRLADSGLVGEVVADRDGPQYRYFVFGE